MVWNELQRMVETHEIIQWLFVNLISAIFNSIINVFFFTKVFKINTTNKNITKAIIILAIFRTINPLYVPAPYYRVINIIIETFIYFKIFKTSIEKCTLGSVINSIICMCADIIFSKITCMFFKNVDTYIEGMYNYTYKLFLSIAILIFRLIIYFIVIKKKHQINLSDNLSKKNRNSIIIISIIGQAIIIFNTMEMTMYISDFPYWIFALDIVYLIIYFAISINNILKITKLEEQDIKIQSLEAYNHTLSIMYDNIRGFRHDFGNFVQALNGYVESNNIEGIKNMSKSLLKDCKNVNNMGILDPRIINNPAVYSIITTKYYLAQENNIIMNIEVMIDIKEIEVNSYELCRILSILLDNAIEAAKESKEKVINVRFLKDNRFKRKLIIIENSFVEENIDIDKIFEKGYTSKNNEKSEHGLGLWIVQEILRKSNNLNLFTSKEELFCQQLEVYNVN